MFTQKKLDRINFRSVTVVEFYEIHQVSRVVGHVHGHMILCYMVLTRWQMDPVMLSIFGVQLLMSVQVVVIRREICDGFSAAIWYRCKETAAFTQRDKSGRAVIRFT